MWEYISKKNDINDEISIPLTLILTSFILPIFRQAKNCKIVKSNESQRNKLPKDGAINQIYITTFWTT